MVNSYYPIYKPLSEIRKQQIILLRMAVEYIYTEELYEEIASKNKGEELKIKYIDNEELYEQIISINQSRKIKFDNNILIIESSLNILKIIIETYINKYIIPNNKKNNYSEIKKYIENPNRLTPNTIRTFVNDAIERDLIIDNRSVGEKQGCKGVKLIFYNYKSKRNYNDTFEELKNNWVQLPRGEANPNQPREIIPREFIPLITRHTKYFIRRDSVIGRFENFLREFECGYFILQGLPGTGKTAIMANYVKEKECPCFFIQRPQRINQIDDFLESICEQLLNKYNDKLHHLRNQLNEYDVLLFNTLLQELSSHLQARNEKLVIVIDALDEVNLEEREENILQLPQYVPEGVYFFMSQRPQNISLQIEAPLLVENIERLIGEGWKQSFRDYYQQYLERSDVLRNWDDQYENKTNQKFIEFLINNSEGNFRYLRYILDDIERAIYNDFQNIPLNLQGYYQNHLECMGIDEANPNPQKIKLLRLLANGTWISLVEMQEELEDSQLVFFLLAEWSQFLLREEGPEGLRYRLYHPSFGRFLQDSRFLRAGSILSDPARNS